MKYLVIVVLSLFSLSIANADQYVNGYYRSNGAYVQGYHRTTADNTPNNNYGTVGNINPYNGNRGYLERDNSKPQGAYNQGNGQGY